MAGANEVLVHTACCSSPFPRDVFDAVRFDCADTERCCDRLRGDDTASDPSSMDLAALEYVGARCRSGAVADDEGVRLFILVT